MAETSKAPARPMAPHLQVWRWHITMATSILHRVTGVGNALGTLMFTWWLIAAATGPEAYATFAGFAASLFGQLILLGFTASVSYHMLNGIRHLFWDSGAGFGLATSRMASALVIAGAAVLTAAIWLGAYWQMGAL